MPEVFMSSGIFVLLHLRIDAHYLVLWKGKSLRVYAN